MFNNAQLKLIAWNLLLTVFVCIILNLVFYFGIMSAVSIASHNQQIKINNALNGQQLIQETVALEEDIFSEVRNRLIWTLVSVNLGLLILTGIVTYFRTTKTLATLKEIVDDQNRFVSDSSHELKTPISAMKIALEVAMMNNKLTLKEAKQIIQDNLNDVNHLHKLTERLLALSKFENKNRHLQLRPVIPALAVSSALNKLKPLIQNRHIKIKCDVIHAISPGNADLLEELFTILIDNAIKYSQPKSTIEIYSEKNNHHLDIHFKDQGVGISKKDISQLFNRFFRADQSRTKTHAHGYGLGLPIAQKIVNLHHGKILVYSKLGKGSDFVVQLPLTKQ